MWEKLNLAWAYSVDTANSQEFWKALVAFGTSIGLAINPDQANAIIAFGMALMGLLHAWGHATR